MAETKEVQNSSDETNMPVDIFEMVKKQDVEAVRSCLATMKNVKELYDSDGMSLLQHAAYRGNKDMCRMLLDHGADVNETKHIHNYTCLHFAALSGNRDVVQMMLEAGADPDAMNSINRTPGQMAAFVGHHAVVASINNFIPKSMVEYYTKPQGLEKDPKIPPIAAPALHSYLIQVTLHPVYLALHVSSASHLITHWPNMCRVLNLMCEKYMKATAPGGNEILAFKTHYLAFLLEFFLKEKDTEVEAEKEKNKEQDGGCLSSAIRKLLKGRDVDGFPEYQERLLRQAIKAFPYTQSTILQQMVSSLGRTPVGEHPMAVTVIQGSINGQHMFTDEDSSCTTCGHSSHPPPKKCKACHAVQYCDRRCQRLHWFDHKKRCGKLAAQNEAARKAVDPEKPEVASEQKTVTEE